MATSPSSPAVLPARGGQGALAVGKQGVSSRRAVTILGKVLFALLALLIVVWSVGPFLWMMITSIKPDRDLATLPPILPTEITFNHYGALFETRPFYRYIINSTIVSVATTLVCLLIGSLAGYAFGRLRFPGRLPLLLAVLVVSIFPQISIVGPLYRMFQPRGLLNTYEALIIPYNAFALPLAIWILTSFFRSIPAELEDASRVDGTTRLGALFRVILPLSLPGLFTTAILVFIAAWNEFLFALTFTTSIDHQTIPVGIARLPAMYHVPWGNIAAASTLVTLPLVVMVLILQRWIVQGIVAGALKG
jgi:ABC-type glycerol-3-phosphate transport system permease component